MTAVDEMKAGMNQGEQGFSGLSVEGDAGIESINTSRSKRKAMDNETPSKPMNTNSSDTELLSQFLFNKDKDKSLIAYDANGNPGLRARSPQPIASSSKVTLEMLLEREAKAKAPSGEKSFNVEVTSKREGKARERAPPEDSQGKYSSEEGPDAKRSRLENEVPVVSVKDTSELVLPVKEVDGKEIVDEQALFNLMQSTASGAPVPASRNIITGDYIVGDNEDDDEDLRLAIMMSMQDGQGASGLGDEYLAAMLAAEESDPMEPMEFDIDAAQMLKEMIDSGMPIDDHTLSVLTELKERQDNVREAEAELARLAEVRKNNYAIKLALQEDRMKEEEALAKQMDAAIGKGKGRAVQL